MRSGLGVRTRGEGRGTRRSALGADGGSGQRRLGGTVCRGRQSRTGRVRSVGWVVWWTGRWEPSGRMAGRNQGESNWVSQGWLLRRRAERVSRPAREKKRRRTGGHHPLVQTDARGPAGQVMGQHLDGQPCAVGGEAARGEMVEADAVLEVSDGILDLGVAAMVGLQFRVSPSRSVMKP